MRFKDDLLTSAYRAVLELNLPVKRAALTYGVPQTTIRKRVLGRVYPETTSSGPPPELSQEYNSPVQDSESENDSEIPEEDNCCVCHKFQPEELKHCVSLAFTKWAHHNV